MKLGKRTAILLLCLCSLPLAHAAATLFLGEPYGYDGALAGTGHVAVTALLGLLITWFGMTINQSIGNWFSRVAGAALLLFGLYYCFRQLTGKGHVHFAYPHAIKAADSSWRT